MARDRRISEGAYLCTLIEIDMGKRSRRPSKQNITRSGELAKIHKAIIACGKKVESNRRDCSDHQRPQDQTIIDELVNLTTAVLQLNDPVRRK
jgi:hypothetical protein